MRRLTKVPEEYSGPRRGGIGRSPRRASDSGYARCSGIVRYLDSTKEHTAMTLLPDDPIVSTVALHTVGFLKELPYPGGRELRPAVPVSWQTLEVSVGLSRPRTLPWNLKEGMPLSLLTTLGPRRRALWNSLGLPPITSFLADETGAQKAPISHLCECRPPWRRI